MFTDVIRSVMHSRSELIIVSGAKRFGEKQQKTRHAFLLATANSRH